MPRLILPPYQGTSQPKTQDPGAKLVFDEAALREPRLLVPGMQPLGPVRVDRTSLAPNNFFLFNSRQRAIDIAGTAKASLNSNCLLGPDHIYNSSANTAPITITGLNWGGVAYSVLLVTAHLAIENNTQVIFKATTGTNVYWQIALNLANQNTYYGNELGTSWPYSSTNVFSVLAVASPGSGNNKYYISGSANRKWKGNSTIGGAAGTSVTQGATMQVYGYGSGWNCQYKLYAVGVWNRSLSDEAAWDIVSHPYQFLIPAT